MSTESESRIGFAERFWHLLRTSFIASLLTAPADFPVPIPHESFIDRIWTNSMAFRVFDWVVNLLPLGFRALYTKWQKAFDNSVIFGYLTVISDNMGLASGLFMAIILAVPQSYWNNLYGLLGVVALVCLFLVYAMRKQGRRFSTALISPYLLVFAAFVCVSFVFSTNPSLSLRFFLFHFTCMLLMLVVVSSLTDRKQLEAFVVAMLAGFAVAALYGCYQGRTGVELVLWQVDLSANAGMPGRVYSFFENANVFAEVLVMLIPFVAVMIVNVKVGLGKILALLILGAAIASLAMTYSRAGYVAIAAVFFMFVLFINWKLVPAFLILGLVAIPFLPDTVFNRITTIISGDSSIASRYLTYDSARKYLADNWLTGTGLGTDIGQKAINSNFYYSNGFKFIHSHSTYVQIWIEMGIFGFLSFLGAIINWFKRSSSWITDKSCPSDLRNLVLAGVSGIVGVLVFALVDYIWFYPRVMVVFWAVIGVTIAAAKLASLESKETGKEENQ